MDRFYLENPEAIQPDEESDDLKLIAATGMKHEKKVLDAYRAGSIPVVEIPRRAWNEAQELTIEALEAKTTIIFQAALAKDSFAGFADFLILDERGNYQVWDTKLARSPKPYFAVQLCCYSEMLAATAGTPLPEKFGVILGNGEKVEFRTQDFFAYYQTIKAGFLALQGSFSGSLSDRPEPMPGADHGRWCSVAEAYFTETDHLVQVAGITRGQIKKLNAAGIWTMAQLSIAGNSIVPKMSVETLAKLVHQARLQCETRRLRELDPDAKSCFEVLAHIGANGESVGLASLPRDDPADVFFDIEGYPLVVGGLEYLWGVCTRKGEGEAIFNSPGSPNFSEKPRGLGSPTSLAREGSLAGDLAHGSGPAESEGILGEAKINFPFRDWWAHDREGEKRAFEGFIDWVYARWLANPAMHIYHYAAYEVSAVRRLSTRHDTRVLEVDDLLRHEVFVDLYTVVRKGLCIGANSYSIKKVELLYRPKRDNNVASAIGSVVQYANWIESGDSGSWDQSSILKDIRDYNEEDCVSTAELLDWLRELTTEAGIEPFKPKEREIAEVKEEVTARLQLREDLKAKKEPIAQTLAELMDFHRREDKPKWWKFFDLVASTDQVLSEAPEAIANVVAVGEPFPEKKSLVQAYRFDPNQECKLKMENTLHFTHKPKPGMKPFLLDLKTGDLQFKAMQSTLDQNYDGAFPTIGSLVSQEIFNAAPIPSALANVASGALEGQLHKPALALLERTSPLASISLDENDLMVDQATQVVESMDGGCLVIQGPPGTGKTYTASKVILSLLMAGKRVGIASNSHKAVINLMEACAKRGIDEGFIVPGVKAGGDATDPMFNLYPAIQHVKQSKDAIAAFSDGMIGGTAWLFSHEDFLAADKHLDYLFVDEAGQVALANAVAMSRSTTNLVLLGDQMQLEQPIQGSHPGWAGLSALQYALLDVEASDYDKPQYHAVVPPKLGLFLGESRRMHSSVCRFISDSIYEGRLGSHSSCDVQSISPGFGGLSHGIAFVGVEHEGNVMQSEEEVLRVKTVYESLLGSSYTDKHGATRPLILHDFLFIAPYNAQVRSLAEALPVGARVGSVDKFQGQEAPVCILSMCSSFGEYGSRGLSFILDRNRLNVAISRAMCLAVVVGDPRIGAAHAGSIDEMRLINLYSKLVLDYSV
jgi:predicted RecB family nuclease